ncbi:dihydroxyacetone kinase subunit L [Erysipelothrix sp. HDW6C]|uniref:dihydroxyacetone kinase subunit DhaL n=1 Tax=Erysipelothrix sp. HDW6C TaxID=2714930 RepID=UPI00140A0068|nr:dihydroxyacetone kinase subunit DhaL [Erysipelothrix sp. HDW6C]QIK70661.1 dihydroxyacetone kinase subunit L [Erysipelothrix sp. HDW6C]
MINAQKPTIVLAMIDTIDGNAKYLSEIDGYTGDGDHGNNMKKGFLIARSAIGENDSLRDAMMTLAMVLIDDIGGSMGPIYGTFFRKLAKPLRKDSVDEYDILEGLEAALAAICDLAGAQVGDKTLVDTLSPAVQQLREATIDGLNFESSMNALKSGAREGWESTKNLQAKLGRAARLGERSIGYYDAGATSCFLLIETLVEQALLESGT